MLEINVNDSSSKSFLFVILLVHQEDNIAFWSPKRTVLNEFSSYSSSIILGIK